MTNILAMNYYDTNVYKNYRNNIEILKDTVEIRHGIMGDTVSIYIIDNNKKYFKKRYLYGEFLSTHSTNDLDRHLVSLISDYVRSRVGTKIYQEINNRLVDNWKCQYNK